MNDLLRELLRQPTSGDMGLTAVAFARDTKATAATHQHKSRGAAGAQPGCVANLSCMQRGPNE